MQSSSKSSTLPSPATEEAITEKTLQRKALANPVPVPARPFRFKHYPIASLGDSSRALKVRMGRIEQVTKAWPGATHFRQTPDGWVRCSKYVQGRCISAILTPLQLNHLCQQLGQACAEGLVHGDVHRKNVLGDEAGTFANLIDWEPALMQLRDGRAVWVATPGWQDPEDIACRTVSERTDLMGIWRLATGALPDFFHLAEWGQIKTRCLRSSAPFDKLLCILNEKYL